MRALELTSEDLRFFLGREPFGDLSAHERAAFGGRRVLVTGGGGSVGSVLVRAALRAGASAVAAVDRSEGGLFDLEGRADVDARLETVVADVACFSQFQRLLGRWRPDLVLHAAAHKHVPLMERHPVEAVRNNVIASWQVLEACRSRSVPTALLLSTDKAADPSAVMGASKRCAERLWLETLPAGPCRRLAVRLPNVLGSAGSVLVRFLEQAAAGEELTVTDESAERYFVTAAEVAGLIAFTLQEGQDGELFALHPGEPTRVAELAARVLERAGRSPWERRIVGLRPGDRLRESLWEKGAKFERIGPDGVYRRRASSTEVDMQDPWGVELERSVTLGDEDAARRALRAFAEAER